MNDRELLELAAKAAGYVVRWHEDTLAHGPTFAIEVEPGNPCGFEPWRPLTDDGDAFRLAVIIRPDTIRLRRIVHVSALVPYEGIRTMTENCEDNAESRASAERRAIVRIAAEIGRTMP